MAQIIVNVCDIHQNEKDEQRQADESLVFYQEGGKPLVLDVCSDCYTELSLQTFAEYVDQYGRPAEPPKPGKPASDGTVPCPYGCEAPRGATGFASMQGLKMHMSMAKNQGKHPDYAEWKASQ